jgi:hypothetical protein
MDRLIISAGRPPLVMPHPPGNDESGVFERSIQMRAIGRQYRREFWWPPKSPLGGR